jgi:hypothetical protein
MHVAVIARSESDEAIQIVAMELWIASAQPVIGRAFARWLAMTVRRFEIRNRKF